MLCILYVIAVGTLLGIAGILAERSLPGTIPRLLVWCHAVRVWLVVRRSRREDENPGSPRVVDGVSIVVTDAVGPATVGVIRSSVLIPSWVLALPGIQRRYVLCHEEQHRKAHDALLLFVASCLLILAPWNLALWWHLRRLRLAVEMDCDTRVVATLGDANAYGELLLKVALAGGRSTGFQPALLGVGMLERRVTALLAPTQLRQVQRFLLPATAVALLIAVLWIPHPVTGHGSHANVPPTSGAVTSSNSINKR